MNRAGMFMVPGTHVWTVDSVTPGGPAAHAGIQAGDAVVSMNGRPPNALGTEGVRAILYGAAGSAVRMQLQRSGKTYLAKFVLRDMF